MLLREILDDSDQYELMTKLLNKQGFIWVDRGAIRNKPALFIRLRGGRKARIQFDAKNEQWKFDVVSGQGHKVEAGTGAEQDVLTFLNRYDPIIESQEQQDDDVPLIWKLVAKEKAKRKRVSWSARINLKDVPFLTGEVMTVDIPGRKIELFADRRTWIIPMEDDDDEVYTLVKDKQADFYWVEDAK